MAIKNRDGALYMATGIDTTGMQADAQKASKIFDGISKDATKAGESANNAFEKMRKEQQGVIQIQKQVIQELKNELAPLEEAFKKVNIGTNDPKVIAERRRLSEIVQDLVNEIAREERGLKELEEQYDKLRDTSVRLRTELNQVTDELVRMKLAGQDNTEEYRTLEKHAAGLKTAFQELNEEQKALVNSGRRMQGVIEGLGALSGILATGAGTMGLLTSNTEKYEKVQTRVQSLISLTIGLQQVQNALDETSAFRVHTVTRAKRALTRANTQLAASLGISTVAAQALMATLTLGLSVAITAAITAYDRFVRKQKEAKEVQEQLNQSISSGVSSQIADYEKLRISYNRLGDDIQEKEQFITDNQSAFTKLGVAIDDVNDADKLFILQTDAFRSAVDQRARATAAMEIAAEKYKEAFKKREDAKDINVTSWNYSGYTYDTDGNLVTATNKSKKLWDEANKGLKDAQAFVAEAVDYEEKKLQILNKAGIKIADDANKEVEKITKDAKINFDKLRDEVLRYEQEYQDKLQELSNTAEQLKIDRIKDENERELRQIEFNYQQRLQAIDKAEERELEKLIEAERKKAMLRGDKNFDPASVRLPAEMSGFYNEMRRGAGDERLANEERFYNDVLDRYRTFEEQRLEIAKRYDQERTLLASENIDGRYDANIEELNKKEQAELAAFDNMIQSKSSILSRMFADMSDKSIEELKAIRDEAEDLWKFLSGGEWDDEKGTAFGITKEQFMDLIADPDKLSRFKKGVDDIREAIIKLDTPLEQIKEGFRELFSLENRGTNKALQGLNKIREGYNKYADAVGLVADAVGALGDLTNSGTLKSIGEGLNDALGVADGAMQGATTGAAFGPAGAIVGAVLGAAKETFAILSRNKKEREALRKQVKENQQQEYFGQLEIEQIWRQKYEWAQKIGESTLDYLKREGEELNKQTQANAKAQQDLWNQLMQQQYKSGEHFKKTGLFGWGKGKVVEEWSSLAGKTWEDIERLAAQGKLSEEGMKFYEALRRAKEEGQDLTQMQEEYLEKLRETYTGSAYESIVSSVVDGFKNGKRSAADFAKSFEDLMRSAVENSLSLLANQELRQWYEDFAEAGKDGYTQEEIDQAKQEWIEINKRLAEQAKALEEATGVKIGDMSGGVTGELKREMTEGTASQLVGLWNMTAMDIRAIKEFFETNGLPDVAKDINGLLNELEQINQNTGRTADNTDYLESGLRKAEQILEEIRVNTKSNNSRV